MFFSYLLFALLLFLVELKLLLLAAQAFGGWTLLLWVLGSALLGLHLLRSGLRRSLIGRRLSLNAADLFGGLPQQGARLGGLFTAAAGGLLLLPGLLSDALGLLLLLPWVRRRLVTWASLWLGRRLEVIVSLRTEASGPIPAREQVVEIQSEGPVDSF